VPRGVLISGLLIMLPYTLATIAVLTPGVLARTDGEHG